MDRNKILITRPCTDSATQVLSNIAKEVKDVVEKVGEFQVIDLHDDKATRKNLESVLDRQQPRLVILNGHGNVGCIYGHKGELIIDADNVSKLKSTIVYAIACDSLLDLGEKAINGGVDAYIGYASRFMIVADPVRSTTPLKDKNLNAFKDVYTHLILSLISGISVKEAVEATKVHIAELIKEYGVLAIRDTFGDAPLIRFALYWDFYALTYLGDGNTML